MGWEYGSDGYWRQRSIVRGSFQSAVTCQAHITGGCWECSAPYAEWRERLNKLMGGGTESEKMGVRQIAELQEARP